MPFYKFKCTNEKCTEYNQIQEIERKITEFNPNELCNFCNEKMSRDIKDLVPRTYVVNCDGFYGKTSV